MGQRTNRRPGGAPTISDVARRAGVSPMTVSRVINGERNVRPQTRAAVDEAVRELRYAPNPAARLLAGAAQLRIGILYGDNPSAGFLGEFLAGSLDQAARSDVQIVLEKCELGEDGGGGGARAARHMAEQGMDGIVLPPPLCEAPAVLDALAAAGVPVVLVATGAPVDGMLAVGIDDREAAQVMTRHLMALGHRRIGFIGGDPNLGASARRLDGYRAALAAAGVPDDPALIVPGLYTYRSGLDAADALLSLPEPPTAVFASNDDMAAATVAVAHRRRLDVPDDLSVCGFDDTALSTAIWPELTTVRQPIADMARAAIDLLVRAVRRPEERRAAEGRRLLDFALVRRQSDGSPPGRGAAGET